MNTDPSTLLDRLRTSYWFVPAIMSILALLLAGATLGLDHRLAEHLDPESRWLYGGDHEGARAVLSVIAASMISVISVVFSITIVALTLAAGQFGSRILRSFMRDRGNQLTLGTFIATFTYTLLVMGTVRGSEDQEFVPPLSVTVGILLVFLSVGVLIYFIHHVARSIQADSVVRAIGTELRGAIDRLYPDAGERAPDSDAVEPEAQLLDGSWEAAAVVRARRDDYLQAVHHESVLREARNHDLVVRLNRRPGDFVMRGEVLAQVRFGGLHDDPEGVLDRIRQAFVQGRNRTMHQDPAFGFHQLVEIAVRALSTGINDPFTAIACVERLSADLRHLAGRTFPDHVRCDGEGRPRLVSEGPSFADFVDAAFSQIRTHGRGSAEVLGRMLEGIVQIAGKVRTEEQRDALRAHAGMILEVGLEGLHAAAERGELRRRHRAAMEALEGEAAPGRK